MGLDRARSVVNAPSHDTTGSQPLEGYALLGLAAYPEDHDDDALPRQERRVRLADVAAARGVSQAALNACFRTLDAHPPTLKLHVAGRGTTAWVALAWITLWLDRVLDGGLPPATLAYLARRSRTVAQIRAGEFQ